jgi:hypothetical protein
MNVAFSNTAFSRAGATSVAIGIGGQLLTLT